MCAQLLVDFKEATNLIKNIFKVSCLITIFRFKGIAMHGIADPKYLGAALGNTLY